MQVIKIQKDNSETALQEIVRALQSSAVLAYPTDTSFGLAALLNDDVAIKKVFAIKQRSESKTLSLIADSVETVKKYAQINSFEDALMAVHWPGPLTLLLKKRDDVSLPEEVLQDGRVAFRVPDAELAKDIVKTCGGIPITATSANISGLDDVYDVEALIQMYQDAPLQPDYIIDTGRTTNALPSTIAKVSDDGKIEMLRIGSIVL